MLQRLPSASAAEVRKSSAPASTASCTRQDQHLGSTNCAALLLLESCRQAQSAFHGAATGMAQARWYGGAAATSDVLLRQRVENSVSAEVATRDKDSLLHTDVVAKIIGCITDRVCRRMLYMQQTELDDEDRAFIRCASSRMVRERLTPDCRRFGKHDRVVCRLAGRRLWAAGTVTELYCELDDRYHGETQVPYLVKIDAPNERVICVPRDEPNVVRAEVCFGQHTADGLSFSLWCKPVRKPACASHMISFRSNAAARSKTRRFGVGSRVACSIEDVSGDDDITWAAGTVVEVDYDAAPDARKLYATWDWPCADGILPYRVQLDSGGYVFVHRDEHWLVLHLKLQPAAACLTLAQSPRHPVTTSPRHAVALSPSPSPSTSLSSSTSRSLPSWCR